MLAKKMFLRENQSSYKRYSRAFFTSTVVILSRVVNIATGLITVPIVLDHLGESLFGLWIMVTSVVAFLSFLDLGVGGGLQNALIKCYALKDISSPRKLTGNAILMTGILAVLVIIVALVVLPAFEWPNIMKVSLPSESRQVLPALQVTVIILGIGIPISLIQRIADAYQIGYVGYSFLLIGRVAGFLLVLLGVIYEMGLVFLIVGFLGAPIFSMLLAWFFIVRRMPFLLPSLINFDASIVYDLSVDGFYMFVIRSATIILNFAPFMLIAALFSAEAVSSFGITQRIYGVCSIITMSIMISLWGAYGEAALKGDWQWIEKAMTLMLYISIFFFIVFSLLMFVFGKSIVLLWVGNTSVIPTTSLLLVCSLFFLGQMIHNICGTFLCGINRLRIQAVYLVLFALVPLFWCIRQQFGIMEEMLWFYISIAWGGSSIALFIETMVVLRRRRI